MKKIYTFLTLFSIVLLISNQLVIGQITEDLEVRPIEVKVSFNEKIYDFNIDDIEVVGGEIINELQEIEETKYRFFVSVPEGEGSIKIKLLEGATHDIAGNKSPERTHTKNYDRLSPIPVISLISDENSENNAYVVNVDFGEIVEEFELEDIQLSNATAQNLIKLEDGKYSFELNAEQVNQDIFVNINSESCIDEAENFNKASNQLTIATKNAKLTTSAFNKSQLNIETKSAKLTTNVFSKSQLNNNEITIYPNPNNGEFNVNYESTNIIGDLKLSILDINGREILNDVVNLNDYKFNRNYNISSYNKGVYLIKIENGGEVQINRIILNN